MDEWATSRATIRDVLSHQSGLPRYVSFTSVGPVYLMTLITLSRHDMSYTWTDTLVDVVQKMRFLRPAFELRQRYHYNNQVLELTTVLSEG